MLKIEHKRTLFWSGGINLEKFEKAMEELRNILAENNTRPVNLFVNSWGGSLMLAFAFYDFVKSIHSLHLRTIGGSYVGSIAPIVLLAGNERYCQKSTVMRLHEFGCEFEKDRVSTIKMEAETKELKWREKKFAGIVATETRLSEKKVLEMMKKETSILPDEMVRLGFVGKILKEFEYA